MMSERNYSKNEIPDREPADLPDPDASRESGETADCVYETDAAVDAQAPETDYAKSAPYADSSIVFIVSGGAVKERKYFSRLMNIESDRFRLVFICKEGQGLVPAQMQREVEEALEEECFEDYGHELVHYFEGDRIYLVTDVDEFGHSLEELTKKNDDRYSWIVSNPCFEIWLFYHFFDDPDALSDGIPLSEDKRSKWLKKKLHDLKAEEGGVDPEDAILHIETAIRNSHRNYKEKENGLPGIYSTQMHVLATQLIDSYKDIIGEIFSERSRKAATVLRGAKAE